MALQSRRNFERCYIRFINSTARVVDIIWIDFNGAYISYKLLDQNGFVDINTFKDHPWVALDHNTRDPLHMDKNFVYYPKTTSEYLRMQYPNREIPTDQEYRLKVTITLPVYSLRYRALLEVRDSIQTSEEIDDLPLPRELKEDLKKLRAQRNIIQVIV